METINLSVRVPNFTPNVPNCNGHIFDKEQYLSKLDEAIKCEFGLPIYIDNPCEVKPDIRKVAGFVKGYSYEDNEAGLILDIEVIKNQIGEIMVESFETNGSNLFACTVCDLCVQGPVDIKDFVCYYVNGIAK